MVKYGDSFKGFNTRKLFIDLYEPIKKYYAFFRPMKECTFHLLTDKPIYEPFIKNYVYIQSDIDIHEHWAKTYFFDPNLIQAKKDDETIIMDIDMFWMNNPSEVITYPVESGQFVSIPRWWELEQVEEYPISGNFYKFKSHDFPHVASIYRKHHAYFRKHYYEKGLVEEPKLGEQHFVYDMMKHADIKLQPAEWCMKESPDDPQRYIHAFEEYTGKSYYDCYDKAIWTHVRKLNK